MDIADRLRAAEKHLAAHDPVMAGAIKAHGPVELEPHTDYYRALASSVIGQQLSVKAAATIRDRFAALGAGGFPLPQEVVVMADEPMRTAGLSRAKVAYVKDLAGHIIDGRLDLAHIAELPNEELVVRLTDVKGIGEWTAHMFLIFCLGRLDVLPVGDLGVRKGMQALYGLPELPAPVEMRRLADAKGWNGCESVASLYLWETLDNAPATPGLSS